MTRGRGSSTHRAERLVGHNLIVGAGTVLAGLLGFAFQAVISHRLAPADYGFAFAVLTVLSLIWLPASAATLVMARETSRDRAAGRAERSASVLHTANRAVLLAGGGLAALMILASPLLAAFLRVPAVLLSAGAVGLPFGLALPLLLGALQGAQRFRAFALISAGQAAAKLICGLGLGFAFGPVGVLAGVSFGSLMVYGIALALMPPPVAPIPKPAWRPIMAYFGVILPGTLSLAVLVSADVILVKHYFGAREAGQYAAVAALGRSIFWAATGVAGVLFPKMIFREARGDSARYVLMASLLLTVLAGTVGIAVMAAWSRPILTAFAGAGFAPAAAYLPWYAVGMSLLGAAAVLVAAHQARRAIRLLWILVPISVLEPALIVVLHQSLMQVVGWVDLASALLLAGLTALMIAEERRHAGEAERRTSMTAAGMSP